MSMSLPDAAADLAACRRLLAIGSRSFDLAARGLPRAVRDDAVVLYAFCRVADDAIDCSNTPAVALTELSDRLDAIYRNQPAAAAVDRAMADLVARHDLPRALPDALLEGLAWDVAERRYATLADLRAYAARVAGSVGIMMTLIMGRRDRDTLQRAAELGVAMQLTNIARDVGEDAAIGRSYLPAAWHRAGDDASALSPEAVAPLVRRLLAEAGRHYAYAAPGIAALPRRCRAGIRAAAAIYAEIGAVIAENAYDSVSRRAVVSSRRKRRLVARALLGGLSFTKSPDRPPAIAETAFLVEVAHRSSPTTASSSLGIRSENLRWWQLSEQWGWVIELFGRLAERDRLDSSSSAPSNKGSRATLTQQR